MTDLRKAAAIVGVHEHPTRYAPDKSEWLIHAESAIAAIQDAGLEPGDIDAYFTSATQPEGGDLGACASIMMADYLNIHPKFIDETDVGGASFGYFMNRAILGIQAGLFKCALIAYGAATRSKMVNVGTLGFNNLVGKPMAATPDSFEQIYGLTVVGLMGMIAQRYMHDHRVTPEQLARVAVTMRNHAQLNPEARYRDPITVEDVLNSGIIASPLHKLDCCLISDGGAAVVVASPEVARSCKKPPVWVLGFGESFMHHGAGRTDWAAETRSMVGRAAGEAFGMAGVTPKDIDMAMIYDAFTINVLLDLEGTGFCGVGEAGAFVEAGNVDMGGPLPINPDGGGLSSNHPGRRGIFLFVEAAKQLWGECGPRQVPDTRVAACTATGAAFLSRRGTAVHVLGRD